MTDYEKFQEWVASAIGAAIISIGEGNFRSTLRGLLVTARDIGYSQGKKAAEAEKKARRK